MKACFTAQLVPSSSEAYLAVSHDIHPWGPNGEPRQAVIFHTVDGGRTWRRLPWKRRLISRIRYLGFPTWPPESVLEMKQHEGHLVIVHRDEWVPFEPGGESLWESVFHEKAWQNRKVRAMDYEGADNPGGDRCIEVEHIRGMVVPSASELLAGTA